MKNALIVLLLLLFVSGCAMFPKKIETGNRLSGQKGAVSDLLSKTEAGAGEGLSTVWALSESNKLVSMLVIFAVVAGGVAAVTRLKEAWLICGINIAAIVGVVLLSVFAEALLKYLWLVGIILIIFMVIGLAWLVLKFYLTAKESFGYAETLKKSVDDNILESIDDHAKGIQPKFVKDTIKWFREK